MPDLVPIYTAADLVQAQLLRELLAESDIEAWIINEALTGAVGEIPAGWSSSPRVVVSQHDATAAREIAVAFDQKVPQVASGIEFVEPQSRIVDAEHWPRCPMCAERRLAVCRFCGQAGVDFPIGYAGPEGRAADAPLQVVCPTCDEPFIPRFYKLCEHCGYEFEDGILIARPQREVAEVPADMTRIFIVLGGMVALFAVVGAYLWWVLR